jgi:hypothetical protein
MRHGSPGLTDLPADSPAHAVTSGDGGHGSTGDAQRAELHKTIWRITRVLPPVSRFSPTGEPAARKATVIKKLGDFFERFFGLA